MSRRASGLLRRVLGALAASLGLLVAACRKGDSGPAATVPAAQVIQRHADSLMAIPGVVGVYEGRTHGRTVIRVMLAANWHTYQILTKRADRMAALLKSKLCKAAKAAHIWWGVSVENRKHGLPRIAKLRAAKPAVAFLSVEPLLEDLGKVDLRELPFISSIYGLGEEILQDM